MKKYIIYNEETKQYLCNTLGTFSDNIEDSKIFNNSYKANKYIFKNYGNILSNEYIVKEIILEIKENEK